LALDSRSGRIARRCASVALLVILTAALGPSAGRPAPVLVDGVAAQVGDEVILTSEVEEQVAILRLRANLPDTSVARAREEILQSLIDEKIVLLEARARGLTVSDEEVEQAVKQHVDTIKQQVGGDAAFQSELAREGLTESELLARYRDDARREILTSRLMQREVYSKIEIPEAELQSYYEEHKTELPKKPGQVELAHVFIGLRAKESAVQMAQAKLDRIQTRLEAGEPFGTVAREESDDRASAASDGALGWFAPGELDPGLAQAVAKLAPGEVSDPFQVPGGVEIIRLAERDGERVRLEHIRVAIEVSEDDRRKARSEAEKVLALARKGTDFAELAREYSDDRDSAEKGGNLGKFDDNELNPMIGRAVRGLGAGELSEVVASEAGFHVFKVLAREGGGEYTYEEVKDRLRMKMLDERAADLSQEYVDGIRKNYFVRRAEHPMSPPGEVLPPRGVKAEVASPGAPVAPDTVAVPPASPAPAVPTVAPADSTGAPAAGGEGEP
jgi:peptidyl-prolyl cis-trans isomerase SurA